MAVISDAAKERPRPRNKAFRGRNHISYLERSVQTRNRPFWAGFCIFVPRFYYNCASGLFPFAAVEGLDYLGDQRMTHDVLAAEEYGGDALDALEHIDAAHQT